MRVRRLAIATKRPQAYVYRFFAFVCIVRRMGNFDHERAIDFEGKCGSKRAFAPEPAFSILYFKKDSVHQIFTGESRIFYLLRGLHCTCFFSGIFPGLRVNCFVLLSHIPHKKSEELPLACLFDVLTGLWLSTPTFSIKGYDYVKHFVRVLVLLVINTGCLKQLKKKKMRNTTLLISS